MGRRNVTMQYDCNFTRQQELWAYLIIESVIFYRRRLANDESRLVFDTQFNNTEKVGNGMV